MAKVLTPPVVLSLAIDLLVAAGVMGADGTVRPESAIVPAPQQWHAAVGTVDILGAPIVVAQADHALLRPTADITQADIVAMGLPKPRIVIGPKPAGKPAIVFVITPDPFRAGPKTIEEQSYAVHIAPDAVTIRAHNRAGIYYGTRCILQMLCVSRQSLPCGTIVDGPITAQRMLMLDVARTCFPIETLYDYLRVLGWYRMNTLHLHLTDSSFDFRYGGFRIESKKFPQLTSKDCFYTQKQLREFQDRAAAMGIMVLPEIDMPGHAAPFTLLWPELAWKKNRLSNHLDVNNPRVVERMKEVLNEMIPLFDAPYMHIGTDEYRVAARGKLARQTADNFHRFINTMNAYIRSKGKQCVVWDGWEHQKSDIPIDPTVVVDMWWACFDTNAYITRGHKVINSNQNVSYLTSGRPTYGVDRAGIYNNWQPNHFGKFNPPLGSPSVIGAKLHVWVGQGPTGWTMTEIADQTLPPLVAFSEKMWGHKGSANYKSFLKRAEPVSTVPGISLFQRVAPQHDGLVLDHPRTVVLNREKSVVPLPLEKAVRADLEFPWTLCMEVRKTDINGRGVILSSNLAEICDRYYRRGAEKPKGGGKAVIVKRTGFGVVRASGNWGPTPAQAKMAAENSRVYTDSLPLNQWVKIAIVANRRNTAVYLDGKLAGKQNQQMICPLRRLGSTDPTNSFIGSIRNLRVYDRALTPEEFDRGSTKL